MKKTFVILVLGSALSLSAQGFRYGVQGALSVPANDLADNGNAGLQAGAHAQWDFRGGHGLMARADLTFYSQNHSTSVSDLAVGADYTYHFERRQLGPYVLAGLSQQNYHTSFSDFSRNDAGLAIDLGAGYDLDRHLGLQARYITNSFSSLTYSSLNLGVVYTF